MPSLKLRPIYLLAASAVLSVSLLALSACKPSTPNDKVLKVGTIAGPETQLMERAKAVAKEKDNLDIEIITFTDYALPNEALSDGSIAANMIQHQPYLDAAIKAKGYQFAVVGKTFIYPMGAYSKKIKNIKELPVGAIVAIPNDPSNEARALLLLQQANLLKLKPGVGILAQLQDVIDNPKKLKIKEIEAAQLPRALADVDLAIINSNYAVEAGLIPTRNALLLESKDSPYANIVVVRANDRNDPKFKQLMEALHSDAVKEEAEQLFKGGAVPAWSNEE